MITKETRSLIFTDIDSKMEIELEVDLHTNKLTLWPKAGGAFNLMNIKSERLIILTGLMREAAFQGRKILAENSLNISKNTLSETIKEN